jgi:hypothetical protein
MASHSVDGDACKCCLQFLMSSQFIARFTLNKCRHKISTASHLASHLNVFSLKGFFVEPRPENRQRRRIFGHALVASQCAVVVAEWVGSLTSRFQNVLSSSPMPTPDKLERLSMHGFLRKCEGLYSQHFNF